MEILADALKMPKDEAEIIYKSLTNSEVKKKKPVKHRVKKSSTWHITLIRFLMGFIGLGASVLSCYYTSVWLFEWLPTFLAIFLSFIMILFAVLAFQVIIIIWQDKEHPDPHIKWYRWILFETKQNFLAVVFAILWLIVTMFSMGSTVAGQYNQYAKDLRVKMEVRETKDVSADKMILENLQKQEKTLSEAVDEKRRYREHIVSSLEQYTTIQAQTDNQKEYLSLRYRLTNADKELDVAMKQLADTRGEIQSTIKEVKAIGNVVEVKDFYEWLSGIFNVSKDLVQFLASIFPAIFIDVIAPTGVAIALFLKKRLT